MTSKSLCFREFPRHCFTRVDTDPRKTALLPRCGIACGVYAGCVAVTGNSISNEVRSRPTAARTEFRAGTDLRVGPRGTATWLPQGRLCGRAYVLALAFSLTWPSASSTEYSTPSQRYCLRICSVFFCTNAVKEPKLPVTFSPAFFLAATRTL